MKQLLLSILLFGAPLIAASLFASESSQPTIRVVNCDANVQNLKRGVCANKLEAADFKALSPSVSWYYSWFFEETSRPPADGKIEFLPMVWGADEKRLEGLRRYLAGGHRPRAVLALNEPNLKDQAFIPPESAAAFYTKIKAVADQYRIPTIGPHMALGSPTEASIKAIDPI